MTSFHPDTRGRWWSLFKAHLFSRAVGREEHCKQIALACAHSVLAALGLPHSQCVCFPSLHCLGSRLLCWELSEASPWLYALPRSELLRFRFSGTSQRHRLVWACVLCPSQARAAQVTKCLASTVSPIEGYDLLPPSSLPLGFLGVQLVHLLRCSVCLFWRVDL